MNKSLTAISAVWLGLFISPATAETLNLSTKAVHTLDLTNPQNPADQGCMVERAYFGDPSAGQHLDIGLDKPQPKTQKITLRWKNKKGLNEVYLQMHLQGCSQKYAQISIVRVDDDPSSPVTYLHNSLRQPSWQPSASTSPTRPPVGTLPPGAVASTPLTLQPTAKRPAPKTVKRPPMRKLPLSQQTTPDSTKRPTVNGVTPPKQPIPTAKQSPSATQVTPATILRGLNVARSKGEIGYQSDMHGRVNGMIRAMRRGSDPGAAGAHAGVPDSVVEALITYAQQ